MTPKFHVLFADDIRTEMNGKLFIVGAYTGGLSAPMPSTSPLSYLIEISGLTEGKHSVKFVIELEAGGKLTFDGHADVLKADETVFITFAGAPMSYTEPGVLTVTANIDGVDYLAGSLNIQQMEQPGSDTPT